MTTFNTGNAVPSADARDRFDNSQTFDEVINGGLTYYPNRVGNNVLSLKGMSDLFNAAQLDRENEFEADQGQREAVFQQFLEGTGWSSLGAYGAGVVITSHTQTVDYLGQPYSLKPSVPASLDAPYVTTGVWATEGVNFKLVGDNSLRQDLADPLLGANIVALPDPLAPAFLKVTSDILNFEAVSVLQNIPKTEWAKIRSRTSDYLTTSAFNDLLAAMRDAKRGKLIVPKGLFRVGGRVGLDYAAYAEIEIEGEVGAEIRNMAYTPTLVFQGSASNLIKASIRRLKVVLDNPDGYTGIMGPKTVFVRYCVDSSLEDIIEEGAIGFGISMQNAINCRGERLVARNHKGGMTGAVGTDGIHFTAVTGATLVDCWSEQVADDCVSVGSFDPAWPSTDVKIVRCGGRQSMGSAVKLYRMIEGVTITDPWADGTMIGGVSLYDDRSDAGSTYGRFIRDVTISGLKARGISNVVGAYNRAAFNIYAQNGTQSSEFSDIRFLDSNARNCISGVVTKIDAPATVRNLEVSRFKLKDQTIAPGLNPCVLIQGASGLLTLHDIQGENLAEGLISLDNQPAAFNSPFTDAVISIKRNRVLNYGLSMAADPTTQPAAIFVRPGDKTMVINFAGNEAYQQTFDGSTSARAPFHFGGDISPLSVINARSCAADVSNPVSMALLGGAGFDGARLNALPVTGTWLVGWSVHNTLFTGTAGTTRKWECSISGTFGALTGVTATGAAGSNLVSLSDASALFAGVFLTISGARYRVIKISGNDIRVDSKLPGVLTAAAVQYAAPSFSVITA